MQSPWRLVTIVVFGSELSRLFRNGRKLCFADGILIPQQARGTKPSCWRVSATKAERVGEAVVEGKLTVRRLDGVADRDRVLHHLSEQQAPVASRAVICRRC